MISISQVAGYTMLAWNDLQIASKGCRSLPPSPPTAKAVSFAEVES